MQDDGAPEIEPRAGAGDVMSAAVAELEPEERLDVASENAAGRQLVTVSPLGQERLASEPLCGELDGLLEWQVLERVQRIVMDEDADRTLRRQQVGEPIDRLREWMVRHETNSFQLSASAIS